MAKTAPPHTLDLSKLSYDPMYDKDGNVVLTTNGKPVSAKLTSEQEARIVEMTLEGKRQGVIAKELHVTTNRVREYLDKRETVEAIARRAVTVNLVRQNNAMLEHLEGLTEVVASLDKRLSQMNAKMGSVSANSMRQKLGRQKAETTVRSQRAQLNKLRRELHKRTGRDDF